MSYIRGRYSWLIRPVLISLDIAVLLVLAAYVIDVQSFGTPYWSFAFFKSKAIIFLLYITVMWLLSAYTIAFYNVYRYTTPLHIISLITKQAFIFSVLVFAYFGFYRTLPVATGTITKYLTSSVFIIATIKFLSFYTLKTYRQKLQGNKRKVVIIGDSNNVEELQWFFTQKSELGYNLVAVYGNTTRNTTSGTVKDAMAFLNTRTDIDEIYCALEGLTDAEVNAFVQYADLNKCNIKFIPETNVFFSKRLKADFYNYLPILSIKEIALNAPVNQFIKRSFDIVIAVIIIVFLLSWLSIMLWVVIKLESKGPLFYKHKRNGLNYKEFYCYKYRSLYINTDFSENYVKQQDARVTRIGRFLRKTSLDELPQFINVFLGDMSVVGPRPHMLPYTEAYAKKIDTYNFIFRHHVKPGITGLAQIKGYRGEIKSDTDIVNRIKYDIFYIDNWSILLDLQIIVKTIFLLIKGDEKAY